MELNPYIITASGLMVGTVLSGTRRLGTMKNKHMTINERIKIQLGLESGHSFKKIAEDTGKDCTSISREVRKHITVKRTGSPGRAFNDCVHRQQAKSFLVVGVLEERDDSLGASYNTALFMPYNTYVQRFRRTDQVGTYVVKVAEGYDATVAADDIEQYLDEIAGEDYYRIFSPATVKEMSDSVMSAFSMFLAAIAAISLIVGGIGIMNIMMVSVVERTGEIGIRKALGATEKAIRSQFLTESVVLSASGGLIGLAAGIAISSAAAGIAGWSLHVSAGAVASSLIFPLLIGIFFGWYPAAKAARLQPMEALARD